MSRLEGDDLAELLWIAVRRQVVIASGGCPLRADAGSLRVSLIDPSPMLRLDFYDSIQPVSRLNVYDSIHVKGTQELP